MSEYCEPIVLDGGLHVEVRRSARRRRVDLIIERDGQVVAAVPQHLPEADIAQILRDKQTWIYVTLDRKRRTEPAPPPKDYVSGEGFYYLGRKYRLKVLADAPATDTLQFRQGGFWLPKALAPQGRACFIHWYTEQAQAWITARINRLKARVAAAPHTLTIGDLGYRWGCCTEQGAVSFHWRTILLPPERIDALILHELVHLHEHHHGPAFYQRLRRVAPDYAEHQEWLRRYGNGYSL
jgi:hypothetical protein